MTYIAADNFDKLGLESYPCTLRQMDIPRRLLFCSCFPEVNVSGLLQRCEIVFFSGNAY